MKTFAIALTAVATIIASASHAAPPPTPTGAAQDVYFGTAIKDPYRWMEAQGPDFLAWANA